MCFALSLAHTKDPSVLLKYRCLALPSLLSSLLWHYSEASHLHLCMVGGPLRHLELAPSIYTIYHSMLFKVSAFLILPISPFLKVSVSHSPSNDSFQFGALCFELCFIKIAISSVPPRRNDGRKTSLPGILGNEEKERKASMKKTIKFAAHVWMAGGIRSVVQREMLLKRGGEWTSQRVRQ